MQSFSIKFQEKTEENMFGTQGSVEFLVLTPPEWWQKGEIEKLDPIKMKNFAI